MRAYFSPLCIYSYTHLAHIFDDVTNVLCCVCMYVWSRDASTQCFPSEHELNREENVLCNMRRSNVSCENVISSWSKGSVKRAFYQNAYILLFWCVFDWRIMLTS